jgi:mannose-6-phosphate isomerase
MPVVLPPNGVPRFYRGGPAIAALRGPGFAGARVPEEWIGSATTVFGEQELGLSRLPDGTLLRDVLAAEPEAYLGPAHARRFDGDPALLVKLLDAGERLPVHLHPDGTFARRWFDMKYGKTEAWIVIASSGPGASVDVGFSQDVDRETLERWVRDQDRDAMLGALNRVEVQPGDAIFVPAGVPHAIGEGLLIVELQEPTDQSILLEWDGFGIADEREATLGLGWERALDCVELARVDASALRGPSPAGPVSRLLPAEADGFFRAQRIVPAPVAELEQGFAIVIVIEGAGELHAEQDAVLELRRGDAVLVPWAAGASRVEGDLVAIACRPPAPEEEVS